ncbi:MAG TPA: hypothetical protein VN829_11545 [Dongiaceae bacterium]|nr:hypothetical protein [Dongiaceae bacterium]
MTKEIDINGIKYRISTAREDRYFFGNWVCLQDGHTGGSSKHCGSEEEALKAGEHNARSDWSFKYGDKPND